MISNAYNDLKERGFINQETDAEALNKLLNSEKITFYIGFDPTGNSLHIGHLLPIMAMRRLQQAGHTPVVLVGGATALIGDPSGKSEARPIITKETVAENVAAIKTQLARYVDLDKSIFVNNADWLQQLSYIDFLREVGYRFSVNKMLAAESVKMRLETGLSFLEFNYSILQAYDFYILNRDHKCRVQFGGQDQWGNIVAGVDLTRRMSQEEVFGMTFPLLLDSNGQKFGKTAGGAVWLDPERTPIFDYYQFWRNCDDADVGRLLGFFSSLPMSEIKELATLEAPAINRAKEILAYEATALAHGTAEAEKAYLAACGKFGFADPENRIYTSSAIKNIQVRNGGMDDLPSYQLPADDLTEEGVWIVKLLAQSGLCASNGEARRLIAGGGAYLNDERISDADIYVGKDHFKDGSLILKAGKKKVKRIIL
ncbi:MAG: tyrosine--tRNA ligase [Victivallales bacterium]|nr:tyrosine--tRNA ligase [Victivallales bacterium]